MKVAIFTEKRVGEGHYQAARAISYALQHLGAGKVDVMMVDGLRLIHPALEWLAVNTYLTLIKHLPSLWAFVYTRIKRPSFIQQMVFSWRLKAWLESVRPCLILCTHPTCVAALARLKKVSSVPYTLAVILTDYGCHPFVISPQVDLYFVPHRSIKEQLINRYGLDPEKIVISGIPVHPLYEAQAEQWIRAGKSGKEGLRQEGQKKIHLLILGGALGLGPLAEILHQFKGLTHRFQLTIICGKNRRLYEQLSPLAEEGIRILGYVEDMANWMGQADLVISKPGGLTVAETLCARKPLIMIKPLPGAEDGNRRFLEQQGLSICAEDLSHLPRLVLDWVENEEWRQRWQGQVEACHTRQAAHRVANRVLHSFLPRSSLAKQC